MSVVKRILNLTKHLKTATKTESATLNELHTYEIDPTPLLDLAVLDEAELMVDPAGSTQSQSTI